MKSKKQYFVLTKRLHDLESDISFFLSQTPTRSSQKQAIVKSIHRRFEFLSALLSAEFSSSPSSSSSSSRSHHHLHRIAHRLSQFETAFRNSLQLNYLELPDHHRANDYDNDSGSTCSCTESCLNEEIDRADDDNGDDESDKDDDDLTGSVPEEYGSLDGDEGRDLNDLLFEDEYYRMGNKRRDDGSGKGLHKIVFRKLVVSFVSCVMIVGVSMVGFSSFHVLKGRDIAVIPPT